MARHGHQDWNLPTPIGTWTNVQVALLMDIRDELQRLNRLLNCPNFLSIPTSLRAIRKNTTKPQRKAKR